MTKNEERIKDWRSTGRRKARKELYVNYVSYECAGYFKDGIKINCGKTVVEPPKDAPTWFDEIWPSQNRVLTSQLQADHESKDFTQNDLSELNWRCPSCHKLQDMNSEKGERSTGAVDMFGFPEN